MLKTLATVSLLLAANATAQVDFAAELEAGSPVLEIVEEAKSDGMTPEEVTNALIDAGLAPARAAFSVTTAWNDCAATRLSVMAATARNSDAVEPIITTIAGIESCGCAAESNWATARLDARIRPTPLLTLPIELSAACRCVTAAVEAAIMSAPDKADRIVQTAVESAQLASPSIDSFGQRFADDDQLFMNAVGEPEPQIFRRRPDLCESDRDELDEFDPEELWITAPAGDYTDIRRFATDCDEGDFDDLVISEFNAEPGVGNYIEFFNGTGETIDLSGNDYRITLYFQGLATRGHTVKLLGAVPPGGTYVISDSSAPEAILRRSDLIVPDLAFRFGDAAAIHAGWAEENCNCTQAIVAGSYRAPDAETGERSSGQTEMVRHKVSRIYGEVDGLVPGQVVDAIGQVDWHDQHAGEVELLQPMLRRNTAACLGDANELDPFEIEALWEEYETANFDEVGKHASDCRSAQIDLVLSEFVAANEDQHAVEIHNPTPADIDLTASGYMIELYRPGEVTPHRVIPLEGYVAGGGNFLVASADAMEELQAEAQMTVNSLDAEETSAIVLKKLSVANPMRCSTQVAAALDIPFFAEFNFVNDPVFPGTNPTPPLVDPEASPN